MAVLIEAISLVIRGDALLAVFENDWQAFTRTVPNATLCADGELVRIGFMTPEDARHYVETLESRGLRYLEAGQAKDMVVVDQLRGPLVKCDWIDFGHINLDDAGEERIAACRLSGSTLQTLMKPDGWQFKSSLSRSYEFAPSAVANKGLKFLRHENGLNVYWSELSGREVFVGRSTREPS